MAGTSRQKRARGAVQSKPALKQTPLPSPVSNATPPEAPRTRSAMWIIAGITVAAVLGVAALTSGDPQSTGHAINRFEDARALTGVSTTRIPQGAASSGELVTREIQLPVPAGYVRASECVTTQDAWFFKGYTPDRLAAFLTTARVPTDTAMLIRNSARCAADGCNVVPTTAVIEGLRGEARDAVYGELRRYPENRLQVYAYLRKHAFGAWSDLPGLSPVVHDALVAGTWNAGHNLAFSDQPWLCARLHSEGERIEALRALRVRYGVDASVRVPAEGDIEALVRYWSRGNDPEDTRRVLREARDHGGLAPVAELLPPMARTRLNRFPSPSDLDYDCFWTAARFFDGAAPSDHMPGPQGIMLLAQERFDEIPATEARLGDMVAFIDPDGTFAHTATHVAGNLLFTKNGRSHQRPWVLMSLDDLREMYPAATQVRYLRQRGD